MIFIVYKLAPSMYNINYCDRAIVTPMNLTASSPKTVESAGDKMLAMIRSKYPEYHPIMAIADIAHKTEDEKVELACHQTVARYVVPELKSIQIEAKMETHRRVTVELFQEMTKGDVPKPAQLIDESMASGHLFGDDKVEEAQVREVGRQMGHAVARHVLEEDTGE